jgi:hypothetical protein
MLSALLVALVVPVQPQVSMSAGASVQVNVPTVQFEAEPPLVEVEPGLMVVPDIDREVFFAGGYYFCNLNGAWFRTRSHHGGWVRVATARVPVAIVRAPRGRYRHFHGGRLVRHGEHVAKRMPKHAVAQHHRHHAAKKAHRIAKHAVKAKHHRKTRAARASKPRKLRSAHRTSGRRHRTH